MKGSNLVLFELIDAGVHNQLFRCFVYDLRILFLFQLAFQLQLVYFLRFLTPKLVQNNLLAVLHTFSKLKKPFYRQQFIRIYNDKLCILSSYSNSYRRNTSNSYSNSLSSLNQKEVLLEAEGHEVFDNGLQYFYTVEQGIQNNPRVVHGVQRPQKRTIIRPLIVKRTKCHSLPSQIYRLHLHRTRDTYLDLDVFLPVGLTPNTITSNINSRAFMLSFEGSLALYREEMNELKCAVVGKMSPLIQFSWVSSALLSLLKSEEENLICLIEIMSGSPRRHLLWASRVMRPSATDYPFCI